MFFAAPPRLPTRERERGLEKVIRMVIVDNAIHEGVYPPYKALDQGYLSKYPSELNFSLGLSEKISGKQENS